MSTPNLDDHQKNPVSRRFNHDDSAIRHGYIYKRIHENMHSSPAFIDKHPEAVNTYEAVAGIKQYEVIRIGSIALGFFALMLVTGYSKALTPNSPVWVSALFIASSLSYSAMMIIIITHIGKLLLNNQTSTIELQRNAIRYQRQSIQLEVAALIARDAADAPDMIGILQRATQLIHERFGYYHAAIFMIEGDYAILKAASGSTHGSQVMLENDYRLRVGAEGIIGKVSVSGSARIALDVALDRIHYANPHLPDTRAEAAIPLKVNDEVVAILDVQSMETGDFDDHDVRILQIMADLLATAINKTMLHETVRDYAYQLEVRVNERTQELISERAQLKAILDNMQEGVIYHRGDEALYINQAFTNLMQSTVDTWQGLEVAIVPAEKQPTEKIISQIFEDFQSQGRFQGEMRLKRFRDKTSFDASVSCTPIDKEFGKVVTVVRDISQEKALQEQKKRFLAYASHELRTPITNLKTRLYLLKKQPHRFDDHYEIINQVVKRMQWLVDDLLNHTRLEQGRIVLSRRKHTVQKLIEDVVTTQYAEANKKEIKITQYLPDDPIIFSFDWERLLQVLTNVVANAINYTEIGGQISIYLIQKRHSIRIDVQDTGIGIPEDFQSQLFQPFVRANNVEMQGTGLGLVISRQIVELHGGTLTFESTEGVGSTFTIIIAEENQPSSQNA